VEQNGVDFATLRNFGQKKSSPWLDLERKSLLRAGSGDSQIDSPDHHNEADDANNHKLIDYSCDQRGESGYKNQGSEDYTFSGNIFSS
jgi:hypothetical protein